MKAVVYEEYAPDDDFKRILQVKEIDEPKPKPNQVVFQVKAAALRHSLNLPELNRRLTASMALSR